MSVLETFHTLIADGNLPSPELSAALMEQADAIIIGYLRRAEMPDGLEATRAMMALALYNRLGAEGEASRAEGEVKSVFETMPEAVRMALRPYRMARAAAEEGA